MVPLVINTVLFAIAIATFVNGFDSILSAATGFLDLDPGSGFGFRVLAALAAAARFVIGLVIVLVFAIAVFFGFTLVGGVIAAPFNEVLSQRTEALLLGRAADESAGGLGALYREALYAIGTELRKIVLYLAVTAPIVVVGFFPVFGPVVSSIAGFLVTSYFLAYDYTDPPMSRRHLAFAEKRRMLRARRPAALGFGAAALGLMAIPILNLALLPVQVVAGTMLFVDWSGERPAEAAPDA